MAQLCFEGRPCSVGDAAAKRGGRDQAENDGWAVAHIAAQEDHLAVVESLLGRRTGTDQGDSE